MTSANSETLHPATAERMYGTTRSLFRQLFDTRRLVPSDEHEILPCMHMHAACLSAHGDDKLLQWLGAVSHLPLAAFISDITARNPRISARNLHSEPRTSYRMHLLHTHMPDSVRWPGYAIAAPTVGTCLTPTRSRRLQTSASQAHKGRRTAINFVLPSTSNHENLPVSTWRAVLQRVLSCSLA